MASVIICSSDFGGTLASIVVFSTRDKIPCLPFDFSALPLTVIILQDFTRNAFYNSARFFARFYLYRNYGLNGVSRCLFSSAGTEPETCRVYGITCLQAYLYYTEHSARDGPPMKIFVSSGCMLEESKNLTGCLPSQSPGCSALVCIFPDRYRSDRTDCVIYHSVLDTFHVALLGHLYYYYTVTNFGDYGRLVVATWQVLTSHFLFVFGRSNSPLQEPGCESSHVRS